MEHYIPFEWQQILFKADENEVSEVKRAKVIGGWIIETNIYFKPSKEFYVSSIFVKDQSHRWTTTKEGEAA